MENGRFDTPAHPQAGRLSDGDGGAPPSPSPSLMEALSQGHQNKHAPVFVVCVRSEQQRYLHLDGQDSLRFWWGIQINRIRQYKKSRRLLVVCNGSGAGHLSQGDAGNNT